MNPAQVEALAQRIVASAALAEGEAEPMIDSEVLEAARAVEAVVREVGGDSIAANSPIKADEPESDEAWFAARPDRTARLRPRLPGDPRPYWVEEGQALMAVVRYFPACHGAPSVQAISADALPEPVADTDKAILAAFRSARGLR